MNLLGEPAFVGRHCGSSQYVVSPEVVAFYAEALDDHNPHYAKFAPPLLHHSECYKHLGQWYLKNLFGNLHGRQDWELFAPIPIGARVRTRSTIVERYHKRGRDYVVNETDLLDPASSSTCAAERTSRFCRRSRTCPRAARSSSTTRRRARRARSRARRSRPRRART